MKEIVVVSLIFFLILFYAGSKAYKNIKSNKCSKCSACDSSKPKPTQIKF